MDSSTYRHLLGQLKKSCTIPHYNFPCHNLIPVETILQSPEFFDDFPCYRPFPYTLQPSSVLFCGSLTSDEPADLVKRKLNWEKKLKTLKITDIRDVRAIKRLKLLRQGKVVKLSDDLKSYIDHFRNDPEPMFSGSYNWLYTGGCLGFDDPAGNYLACGDLIINKPGLNILQLDENHKKVIQKSFCQLKSNSPILQIAAKSHNNNVVVCVRQNKNLSLFNADTVKLWRKKVGISKLLTSVDVGPDCEKLIVTDTSYDINVFDVEKKYKICGQSGKKIASGDDVDFWNQIEFGDHGVFWGLRNQFAIIDLRDRLNLKLTYNPSKATNTCENITAFVKSKIDSNFVYICTSHHVIQLDLRNGKALQRWTHLMKNPPQFMSTVQNEDCGEIILLQSSSIDEIIGIYNDGSLVSKSLPCLLKSVKESLNSARISGVCLSPSVSKRLEFSVTGMQCLKNKQGDMTVFTTNSGGDVFSGRITNKNVSGDENEPEILKSMESYESHVNELPLKKSKVKHVDMSRVVQEFEHSKVQSKKSEMHWKYHEMYTIDSLRQYQDVLAQKILNVWLPSYLEKSENEDAVMSVEAKVREWMNKN